MFINSISHINLINIILVICFLIFYIIGTYTRFNYLDLIYKGHPIPLYCIIILIILLAFIWQYNRTIGILYGILIIFQLKRIIINSFVNPEISQQSSFYVEPTLLDTEDKRFKRDNVKIKEILRQIQAEINFDPYKTPLARKIIIDIYEKYFNNDMFIKLQEINDNSKQYQKEYKLLYMTQPTSLDYSISMADILSKK